MVFTLENSSFVRFYTYKVNLALDASDLRKQSSKFLMNFNIGHIILCRPAKIEVLTTLLPDTNTLSFSMLYVGLNDQITGGDHCHLHRVCINSQQPTPALTTHYELSQP